MNTQDQDQQATIELIAAQIMEDLHPHILRAIAKALEGELPKTQDVENLVVRGVGIPNAWQWYRNGGQYAYGKDSEHCLESKIEAQWAVFFEYLGYEFGFDHDDVYPVIQLRGTDTNGDEIKFDCIINDHDPEMDEPSFLESANMRKADYGNDVILLDGPPAFRGYPVAMGDGIIDNDEFSTMMWSSRMRPWWGEEHPSEKYHYDKKPGFWREDLRSAIFHATVMLDVSNYKTHGVLPK